MDSVSESPRTSEAPKAPPQPSADVLPKGQTEGSLEVSIVIPVYNEVGALEETVRDVTRYMNESGLTYEVILVDDGSTDGSGELIAKISLPHVKAVQHTVNQGYGAALKTGLKKRPVRSHGDHRRRRHLPERASARTRQGARATTTCSWVRGPGRTCKSLRFASPPNARSTNSPTTFRTRTSPTSTPGCA